MRTVAEGVETQIQLDELRLLRCDQYQGYLFARPAPAGEITQMFLDRTEVAIAGPVNRQS